MSSLTQKERDALDEIFLAIHSKNEKNEKMKKILIFLVSSKSKFKVRKYLIQALIREKTPKALHLLSDLLKKKNFLSK